jgi:cell volume regulation protein A
MKILKQYGPVLFFLTLATLVSFTVQHSIVLLYLFTTGTNAFYFALTLLFAVGYGIHHFAPKNEVPVFVWAILFGIALQVMFVSLTTSSKPLLVIIDLLAAFILFSSGLRVPVKNFKRYFAPIATLSVAGTLLTILLFAITLSVLTLFFGFEISSLAILVLAAILSSIDPTTVIPTLEHLHFRRQFIRDIAIAESAVNDVVGVVVSRFFLLAALGVSTITLTVGQGFSTIFSRSALHAFALDITWGILIGLLGAWILTTWGESVGRRHWSDPGLFFIIPIFCFALGSMFDGSGFLAAFIAGLLFEANHKTEEVHVFFEGLVDRFLKPVIFVLLGAMVSLTSLVELLPLGIVTALVFMFILRPLVVYLSLLPWMISINALFHWKEALFLSFIRETGAVPAVLLLFAAVAGLVGVEFIFALGVWVILLTLTIEPPLTALLAKRLEIAD